jgi:hypothetical protein
MKALLFVVIALVASSFTLCNAQPRNWSHIDGAWGTGTPKAFAAAPNGHLFAMVIDSRNQGKLFRSIDHGAKWQQIYEFPNDEYLQTLTLSALKRGEVIYTCVDTTSYMRKMFISTDDGESWTFSFQTPFTTGWGGMASANLRLGKSNFSCRPEHAPRRIEEKPGIQSAPLSRLERSLGATALFTSIMTGLRWSLRMAPLLRSPTPARN